MAERNESHTGPMAPTRSTDDMAAESVCSCQRTRDEWPSDRVPVVEHDTESPADFELGRRARFWDQFVVQAVLRSLSSILDSPRPRRSGIAFISPAGESRAI